MTSQLGGTVKWQIEPSDFVQTFWTVSWAKPHLRGGIDYLDDDLTGCCYPSKEQALEVLEVEREKHPEAYLIRITYAREDLLEDAGV